MLATTVTPAVSASRSHHLQVDPRIGSANSCTGSTGLQWSAAGIEVSAAGCGPETSCYECLRNNPNQPYQQELQRGTAKHFIPNVLAQGQ